MLSNTCPLGEACVGAWVWRQRSQAPHTPDPAVPWLRLGAQQQGKPPIACRGLLYGRQARTCYVHAQAVQGRAAARPPLAGRLLPALPCHRRAAVPAVLVSRNRPLAGLGHGAPRFQACSGPAEAHHPAPGDHTLCARVCMQCAVCVCMRMCAVALARACPSEASCNAPCAWLGNPAIPCDAGPPPPSDAFITRRRRGVFEHVKARCRCAGERPFAATGVCVCAYPPADPPTHMHATHTVRWQCTPAGT